MITLKDKLSHLSYSQACKRLGTQGKQLILAGGKYDIDLFESVTINNNRFRLDLEDATVEIALDPMKPRQLKMAVVPARLFASTKMRPFRPSTSSRWRCSIPNPMRPHT